MNLNNNEKLIIQILKFAPVVFILITSITLTYYINYAHDKDIQIHKDKIKQNFIIENKNIIKNNVDTIVQYIEDEKILALEDIKLDMKHRVYNGHKVMSSIYKYYKDEKSKEEITKLIKNILHDIKFNNNRGYFFIYEEDGKNILNPEFKNLEGKNLWNFKDAKGI